LLKLIALIMLTVWQTAQAAPIEPWTKSLTCADGKYLGSSEAYQRDRPPFKMKFLPTAGLSLNANDKADIRSSFELTRPRLDD